MPLLNKKKTKAMWLGSLKHNRSKILAFKTTNESIKVLGVHLSYNAHKCLDAKFYEKLSKMRTKLNLWLSRDLTIYGKSACEGFRRIVIGVCSVYADCS